MNPNQAWKAHGHISRTIVYRWYAEDQKKFNREIEDDEGPSVKRKGRPKLLNENHTTHLKQEFKDNPSVTIEQAQDSLVKAFSGLAISQTTIYNYMTNDLALTFKKAHFHSKERNSPQNIQNWYDWVVKWGQTDMDYVSNCVFIDESAFHISLKRTMAWSEKGTRAEVVVPQTRAKTTAILGATSVCVCGGGVECSSEAAWNIEQEKKPSWHVLWKSNRKRWYCNWALLQFCCENNGHHGPA